MVEAIKSGDPLVAHQACVDHVRAAAKVARYELSNVARSRWLVAYMLFFLVATDALLRFGGGGGDAAGFGADVLRAYACRAPSGGGWLRC